MRRELPERAAFYCWNMLISCVSLSAVESVPLMRWLGEIIACAICRRRKNLPRSQLGTEIRDRLRFPSIQHLRTVLHLLGRPRRTGANVCFCVLIFFLFFEMFCDGTDSYEGFENEAFSKFPFVLSVQWQLQDFFCFIETCCSFTFSFSLTQPCIFQAFIVAFEWRELVLEVFYPHSIINNMNFALLIGLISQVV